MDFVKGPIYEIDDYWDIAKPFILQSFEAMENGQTLESIYKELKEQRMQLWLIYLQGTAVACTVTLIQHLPKMSKFNIYLCGGRFLDKWIDGILGRFEEFALLQKCDIIEIAGRDGWAWFGKPRGFEKAYTVIRKALHG